MVACDGGFSQGAAQIDSDFHFSQAFIRNRGCGLVLRAILAIRETEFSNQSYQERKK